MIHVPNVNQTIFQIVREIRISEGLAESVDECAQRKRAGKPALRGGRADQKLVGLLQLCGSLLLVLASM